MAKSLGVSCGEKGLPKKERRDILKKAFYQPIPIGEVRFNEEHVKWWGQAGSPERFQKLLNWLSSGKINSNSRKLEMTEAVNDWTEDLEWLESVFKKEVFPEKSPE